MSGIAFNTVKNSSSKSQVLNLICPGDTLSFYHFALIWFDCT